MKYCESCGKELNDNSKFCTSCGMKCDAKIATVSCDQNERVANVQDESSLPAINDNNDCKIETRVSRDSSTNRRISKLIVSFIAVVVVLAVFYVVRYWTADGDSARYVKSVCNFSEGLAWIETYTRANGRSTSTQYACIDTTGNVLFMLDSNTSKPSEFIDGVSYYKIYNGDGDEGVYNIIDSTGNVVLSSEGGLFDAVMDYSGGCFAVYKYTESFEKTGYTVFFINHEGKVTNQIDGLHTDIPELINCGEGVFAKKIWQNANAEITYRFYDANSGSQYEIDEIGYHNDISNIFNNGYAVIEGPRMGDIPRLVSTDGQIIKLDYFGYGSFYDFGPVSDGGFVCTSYDDDKVEHVWFYDITTGSIVPMGDYGERVNLGRAEELFFDDGNMLLPLIGADGKNYYVILDKSGQSLSEPIQCQSVYALNCDRIGVQYASGNAMLNGTGEVVGENINGVTSLQFIDGWSVYSNRKNYIDIYGNLMFEDGKLSNEQTDATSDRDGFATSSK